MTFMDQLNRYVKYPLALEQSHFLILIPKWTMQAYTFGFKELPNVSGNYLSITNNGACNFHLEM